MRIAISRQFVKLCSSGIMFRLIAGKLSASLVNFFRMQASLWCFCYDLHTKVQIFEEVPLAEGLGYDAHSGPVLRCKRSSLDKLMCLHSKGDNNCT